MLKTNKEPDFVNEEGVKWWKDDDLTGYAQREDVHGTRLENVVCWIVEFPDGVKTRLLVDNGKGKPLFENQVLEAMAVRIDVMKMLKKDRINARTNKKAVSEDQDGDSSSTNDEEMGGVEPLREFQGESQDRV